VFLKLEYISESSEGLVKAQMSNLTLEFLTQYVWDEAVEFAFLTSFQVMLLLLIQAPQP
jgi:hypothetical protein